VRPVTASTTKVLALLVGRDDGVVQSYFGVEWEEKLWLVNAWLIDPATDVAIPERMVRVDNLSPRPQKCDPGGKFDYMNVLLPKAVIEARQEVSGYEVRVMPDEPRVRRDQLNALPSILCDEG
jgi:hypothetical protein